MAEEIRIRAATEADVGAASALLVEAWHATYDGIYGKDKVDDITARWHAPEVLLAQLRAGNGTFLIAETGGRLLATSYARRIDGETVMLDRIYVRPDGLGGGIGKRLMSETLAAFPGMSRVRLDVAPENARAVSFYQRLGFAKVGAITSCGSDSGLAADIYEKKI